MIPKSAYTVAQLETELKRAYRDRKARDSSYSYRTMARDLDFNFSTLYRVLTGDRKLGRYAANELAAKLGLEIVSSRPSQRTKKKEPFELKSLNPLSDTHIHWLTLAILESMKLADFKPSTFWIATRFGLPKDVCETLLQKMERDGLLDRSGTKWRDCMDDAASLGPSGFTGAAVRKILKDVMLESVDKIESVPFELREHSFALFPVASRQLPLLKKKLNTLQREFGAFASKSKLTKNEVYAFHLGFYPVTQETSS